ncbi:MAG: 23S rRNA (pseudouridine(1915)-N(3))-methyltransferase RlmH [Lachnospiraceae bacterium]|nr:23S rRNA (pseudouridine(1915)-N(3))-methyltransferase RlmH [Lachnospiraceae bacterium]MBQ7781323.1 23S rRNA (pseudouridine(1915)-N(3))-methyltransferase RlmH [Lachnospiraceae bacterium]
MRISIVCVGKIKEKFYRDAIDEYAKRLSRYCKLEILEVPDEKTPDNASEAEEAQIKKKESERILSKIKEDAYVITLEILGKKMDSPSFGQVLEKAALSGKSHIQFVIGGSLGLHETVSKRADLKISFSDMTFPHQLMRVILCEQIYRGYRIINGEPYHK